MTKGAGDWSLTEGLIFGGYERGLVSGLIKTIPNLVIFLSDDEGG